MAAKTQFSLILWACLAPLAQAFAAECPEHAEMKYVTTQGDTRTTYCACVAGYSNQGGVCKPIVTHNWRIDLPKLAHDAETAAGNSQQPATGTGQR